MCKSVVCLEEMKGEQIAIHSCKSLMELFTLQPGESQLHYY